MDTPAISIQTLVLARKYTDTRVQKMSEDAIAEAVQEAVAQSNSYTDQKVSELVGIQHIEIVATLPQDPDTHTLYLVPKGLTAQNNAYFEYLYVDNKWELIGDTEIDLSNYYTKHEVDTLIEENKYVLPVATAETLGGIKVDTNTMSINNNGVIAVNTEAESDRINEVIQPIEENDIASLFNN